MPMSLDEQMQRDRDRLRPESEVVHDAQRSGRRGPVVPAAQGNRVGGRQMPRQQAIQNRPVFQSNRMSGGAAPSLGQTGGMQQPQQPTTPIPQQGGATAPAMGGLSDGQGLTAEQVGPLAGTGNANLPPMAGDVGVGLSDYWAFEPAGGAEAEPGTGTELPGTPGPSTPDNNALLQALLADLMQRNTEEERRLAMERSRSLTDDALAANEARLATMGFGVSGVAGAMGGDIRRAAERDLSQELLGIDQQAIDNALSAAGLNLGEREIANKEEARAAAERLLQQILDDGGGDIGDDGMPQDAGDLAQTGLGGAADVIEQVLFGTEPATPAEVQPDWVQAGPTRQGAGGLWVRYYTMPNGQLARVTYDHNPDESGA